MVGGRQSGISDAAPVTVTNADGRGPFVLLCDHASNDVPEEYAGLGLDASELARHIAWDPGALAVAEVMSARLDAPLVASGICRLVIDTNRPLDAPDLIPEISETTIVPGNQGLTPAARERRLAQSWRPFHAAADDLVRSRVEAGRPTMAVSVHSFTPVYKGVPRPWHIGIIHDDDTRLAGPLVEALKARGGLNVGVNEPYSPADRVYFTLEMHGRSLGLACAMIEIRNDEVQTPAQCEEWGGLLADVLSGIADRLPKDEGGNSATVLLPRGAARA